MDLSVDETGAKKRLLESVKKYSNSYTIEAVKKPKNTFDMVYHANYSEDIVFDKDFLNTKYQSNRSDYLKYGSVVLGSVVVGNVATRHLYAGEEDKKKHALVGGAISAGATVASMGIAYLIPDEKLSPVWKKLLIGCSGFLASSVAGILKEGYDSRHRDRHTVDAHDAFATSLGGGAGVGCVYSVKF